MINKYEQTARTNIKNKIIELTEIHKLQNEFKTIMNFPEHKFYYQNYSEYPLY